MEFKIEDKNCWICGTDKDLTYHHTLHQHWKPQKNVVIPICKKCHDRLNAEDIASMLQFAYKIEMESGRQTAMWGALRSSLERYLKGEEALMAAFKKKEGE